MAKSKIEVVIDVKTEKVTFAGGEVKNLRQQARLLNEELQRTEAGTKEYQLLVEAIGDVEDATRRAKTATQEIYGTLGALPGPIGDITNNANKMVDTFKTLGTLKTTELRAQFVTLGKDLKEAGQGFLNLIGFTKLYEANVARLTGVKNKDTAATVVNTQATEVSAAAQKQAAASTATDTVATNVNTSAKVTATVATRAFAAALAALPFVAIGAGIALLVAYWDDLKDAITGANDVTRAYEDAQKEATSQVADFQKKLYDVKDAFEQAKAGTISKKEALEKYNESLGNTVGFANSLEEAENLMVKNTAVVIESIRLRATAQSLYAKAADLGAQVVTGEAKTLSFWEQMTALTKEWVKGNRKDVEQLQKDLIKAQEEEAKRKEQEIKDKVKALETEGNKLMEQAIDNDKKLVGTRTKIEKKTDDKAKELAEARKKALEAIAKAEADAFKETLEQREKEVYEVNQKYSDLQAEAVKYGQSTKLLEEARLAALKKLTDKYEAEDKKKKEDAEKLAKDGANRLLNIQKTLNDSLLGAMKSGTEKEKAEAKKSGEDKIAAFKKELLEAQDLKLLTAEEVATKLAEFTKNVNTAIQNQIDDLDKKDLSKKIDERLKLLQIQSQGLLAGTQAYFDNRRAIINASEQKELEDTELTEEQKTAIQQKYANQRKQLREEEVASIGQTVTATIDAVANLTSALASSYDEEAKTSKDAFEKRKKLQIATATMSAASGVIQILTQPSTLPSPFDWIVKGINAAALIAATIININKIKKTEFQAPDTSSSANSTGAVGTTFAKGGLLEGPSHARGGIKTSFGELEGGEYVINKRSTASFLPLLTAINSVGNRKYQDGGMMANMDTVQAIMAAQQSPIVKTYVVASDMTSQQEANKKLMDLAKI